MEYPVSSDKESFNFLPLNNVASVVTRRNSHEQNVTINLPWIAIFETIDTIDWDIEANVLDFNFTLTSSY